MHWVNFPLLYSKVKMATTIIKIKTEKLRNILLTCSYPHLGIQNLYLSQRALKVPPDYLSTTKPILTAILVQS
jgi:hypothetical protein